MRHRPRHFQIEFTATWPGTDGLMLTVVCHGRLPSTRPVWSTDIDPPDGGEVEFDSVTLADGEEIDPNAHATWNSRAKKWVPLSEALSELAMNKSSD